MLGSWSMLHLGHVGNQCQSITSIAWDHPLNPPEQTHKTHDGPCSHSTDWCSLHLHWFTSIQKIDPSPPTKELAPPQPLHCIEAPVYQIETCEHRCCFQIKSGFISMMTYLSGRCRFFMTQAPWIISTSTTAWSSNWWLILPHLEIIPVTLSMQGQGKIR